MEGHGSPADRVSWDEAREILAVVLVAAAVMHLTGPMVRYLANDNQFPLWDDLSTILNNVNALTGALLLGAAVVISTTPAVDVVPRLRRVVYVVSALVSALGMLYVLNVLTVVTAGDKFFLRLGIVLWRPRSRPFCWREPRRGWHDVWWRFRRQIEGVSARLAKARLRRPLGSGGSDSPDSRLWSPFRP